MNTRKCERKNVVKWIALVIQVLIVLDRGSSSTSQTSTSVDPTSSPGVNPPHTTPATSSGKINPTSISVNLPSAEWSAGSSQASTPEAASTSSVINNMPGSTTSSGQDITTSNPVNSPSSGLSTGTLSLSASPVISNTPESTPLSVQTSISVTPSPSGSSTAVSSSLSTEGSSTTPVISPAPTATSSITATNTTAASTSAVISNTPGPTSSSVQTSISVTPSPSESPTTEGSSTTPVISPVPTATPSITATNTTAPLANSTTPSLPSRKLVYIKITFKMNWGRFCSLKSVFKESLSRDMIQANGSRWEYLSTKRIKLMNANELCSNISHHSGEAVLEFYISKSEQDLGTSDADKIRTIEAFERLHRYWKTKRMILLDKVFEGKVSKVELIGEDPDLYVDEDTEERHIGIAIGVALAIIVVLLIIIHCVKSRSPKKRGDKKMIFTNPAALDEDIAIESGNANQPQESKVQPSEEPEEVVVHTQPPETQKSEPVTKAQDEVPLLSTIMDYEDGKKGDETKSDEEPGEGGAPLAKPDPEISEGEPITPPDETGADAAPEPPKTEDEGTEQPSKPEDEGTDNPAEPEDEGGLGERRPTFTSSLTLLITPDATSTPETFDFPEKGDDEKAPADTGDESAKPDFEQSDNSPSDPTDGAINLGFEGKDEEPDAKEDPEEETKF